MAATMPCQAVHAWQLPRHLRQPLQPHRTQPTSALTTILLPGPHLGSRVGSFSLVVPAHGRSHVCGVRARLQQLHMLSQPGRVDLPELGLGLGPCQASQHCRRELRVSSFSSCQLAQQLCFQGEQLLMRFACAWKGISC